MTENQAPGSENEFASDAAVGKAVKGVFRWFVRLPIAAKLATYVLGLIGATIGGSFISHGATAATTDATSTTSSVAAAVAIDPPTNGAVARCELLQGTATLPEGDGILIIVGGLQPPVYYLEGMAVTRPSQTPGDVTWAVKATIGSATKPGVSYEIDAVILSPQATQFLSSMESATTLKSDVYTQATTSLPPYLAKASETVQRDLGSNESTC